MASGISSPTRSSTWATQASRNVHTTRPVGFKLQPQTPRHLLFPTTRRKPLTSPQPPKHHHSSKLHRSRASSVDFVAAISSFTTATDAEQAWLQLANLNLEYIESSVEVEGYQLFVVEQWLVDRFKVVRTVAVYTGSADDKILVTVFGALPAQTPEATEDRFQQIILDFRKDGARPRETEKGVIMTTSLASFRSDLNLVLIPNGDFLSVRDDLYVNINLQRLGASGRSGLDLSEPSPSSREKFLQMFGVSEPRHSSTRREWFRDTVLEVVRTVQTALSLFGKFNQSGDERDGLICDRTVSGMQQWFDTFGVRLNLEPMERVLDPSAVACLLGLVVTIRNRLALLSSGYVPKDPFLDPPAFLAAILAFCRRTEGTLSSRVSSSSPPLSQSIASSLSTQSFSSQVKYIDWDFIVTLDTAYAKTKQTEPYKVRRVLKSKIDDLTNSGINLGLGLRSADSITGNDEDPYVPRAGGSSSTHAHGTTTPGGHSQLGGRSDGGATSVLDFESSDMDSLVRNVTASNKGEIPPSLRDIWVAGRPGAHRKMKEREDFAAGTSASAEASSSHHHLGFGLGGHGPLIGSSTLNQSTSSGGLGAPFSLAARYPNLKLEGEWDDDEEPSLTRLMWRETGGKVQEKGRALAHGFAGWTTGLDSKLRPKRTTIGEHRKANDGDSDTSGNVVSPPSQPFDMPNVIITSDKSPEGTDMETDRDPHRAAFYSPASSYRSPASSVTNLNLSDYERGLRKFNSVVAPLDISSIRAGGVTHSDPHVFTLNNAMGRGGPSTLPPSSLGAVSGLPKESDRARTVSGTLAGLPSDSSDTGLLRTFRFPPSRHQDGQSSVRSVSGGSVVPSDERSRRFSPDVDGTAYGKLADGPQMLTANEIRSGSRHRGAPGMSLSTSNALSQAIEKVEQEPITYTDPVITRRRSISHISEYGDVEVLEPQYLQIDVELAFEYVLLEAKERKARDATMILGVMMESLTHATSTLSSVINPQASVLPELDERLKALTTKTREGRNEANALKRKAETSQYQADRLTEGVQRLDKTLETYRKRMDDVEQALEGLYVLEKYQPLEPDAEASPGEEADAPLAPTEGVHDGETEEDNSENVDQQRNLDDQAAGKQPPGGLLQRLVHYVF